MCHKWTTKINTFSITCYRGQLKCLMNEFQLIPVANKAWNLDVIDLSHLHWRPASPAEMKTIVMRTWNSRTRESVIQRALVAAGSDQQNKWFLFQRCINRLLHALSAGQRGIGSRNEIFLAGRTMMTEMKRFPDPCSLRRQSCSHMVDQLRDS